MTSARRSRLLALVRELLAELEGDAPPPPPERVRRTRRPRGQHVLTPADHARADEALHRAGVRVRRT